MYPLSCGSSQTWIISGKATENQGSRNRGVKDANEIKTIEKLYIIGKLRLESWSPCILKPFLQMISIRVKVNGAKNPLEVL
ncbi:MAG TPA: hypothetical protein DDY17_01580 [Syntrophaceae bacterium]|jgi:hypothetical protein|nr:hypothetical protein [Syntrophaceae bacterium]